MGKIVQWLGDAFDTAKSYVGPAREIRVDTTNNNLRLHDGSTPGGHVILNEEQMDARYQVASGEISGITGFGPTDRGWLVRKGDGAYVLRIIQANANNEITIDNTDGFAGSPTISLANTFTNAKTFSQMITASAGVTGNLTGNSTGAHTGDVNVSGHTLTLDANQIPASKIDSTTLTALIKTSGSPIGLIAMWSTAVAAIPTGWALCDGGTHNAIVTPDLRDKFIVGAGGAYTNGQTGGVATQNIGNVNGTALNTAQMPAHAHTVNDPQHSHTVNDPTHNHGISWGTQYLASVTPGSGIAGLVAGNAVLAETGPANTASAAAGVSVAAAATGVTLQNTGGGGIHDHTTNNFDNRPPFYALCFIMHVGP
jgi:microcystin-dependent protein